MPTILLINDNKIVSRLLQLSSQKHNYALEEINDYTASEDAYNVIFIDSEKFDEAAWEALKSTLQYDKLGFIGDKTHPKPEGFDLILEKPFLPTDFVNLMDENFKVMDTAQVSDELDAMEEIDGEDELDLDNLEELELESDEEVTDLEKMDELDELEVNLDDENLDTQGDVILEPETALTTGIAASLAQDESKEELADIVNEIDNMENPEKELEEMDLDALVEEDISDSIVDDTLVKESLEEVEESIIEEESEEPKIDVEEEELVTDDDTVSIADEEDSSPIEDIATTEEIEEEEESSSSAAVATGIAAAVATTVTGLVADENVEDKQEVEEALNILDGVEAIEHEGDYLKENDHVVQDLADEFDSLNASEVEQIMSGESTEEILSEEIITEGEEKVVEANDLEEMITRAVAKAITKEMLQEALNDMEISITLKTKKV